MEAERSCPLDDARFVDVALVEDPVDIGVSAGGTFAGPIDGLSRFGASPQSQSRITMNLIP